MRLLADIQQEYAHVCAKLGELTYVRKTMDEEERKLTQRLTELNHEARTAQPKADGPNSAGSAV